MINMTLDGHATAFDLLLVLCSIIGFSRRFWLAQC